MRIESWGGREEGGGREGRRVAGRGKESGRTDV